MTLYIKNMVCDRCKAAVQTILEHRHLSPANITLGEVKLAENMLTPALLTDLANDLRQAGFELIDDRKSRMIGQIKNLIVTLIHHTTHQPREKYSELISAELHHDYSYLSKLFSEVEGITIEHYIIAQKTEKAKEYLMYDELSLSEIAELMGYKSVAHLSAQFRKVTGLSPTAFKKMGTALRKPLDKVGVKDRA